MNVFQFAANLDANYRAQCSQFCEPFEVEWTWCSDIAIAIYYEKIEPGSIKKTIDDAFAAWNKNFTAMRDLVTAINYLCWWTYENEEYKQYSPMLSDLYHSTLDKVYESLTEEEKAKLWRILD